MAVGPQTLSLDETDYVGIGVKEEGGKRARECEEEEKKKQKNQRLSSTL